MGYDSNQTTGERAQSQNASEGTIQLDAETLQRVDYALEGTIDVDLSNLSADDKLTLLIERYNRKTKERNRLEETDDQRT